MARAKPARTILDVCVEFLADQSYPHMWDQIGDFEPMVIRSRSARQGRHGFFPC